MTSTPGPPSLPLLPPLPEPGRLLGLSGAPGAGTSTLAAAMVAAGLAASVLPLDGFHYADVELRRRALLDRKGAPDTFDAPGYAALLRRVRDGEDDVVAPGFERDLEQPLAGAVAVPSSGLVVTEGNYLLLDDDRWRPVRTLLDAVWHLRLDDAVRTERLVTRHVRYGKTESQARAWVAEVDAVNAARVEDAAGRADHVVDLTDWHHDNP